MEARGRTYIESLRYGDGTAEELGAQFGDEANKILTEAAQAQ